MITPPSPTIRRADAADRAEWFRMRRALWPNCSVQQHEDEIVLTLTEWEAVAFVAERSPGRLCGFAEVAIRPYVEGCSPGPVGYLEGWYVDPDLRCLGIGLRLLLAAEKWVIDRGCTEIASDAEIDNPGGVAAHRALGFIETSRTVNFRKRLQPRGNG